MNKTEVKSFIENTSSEKSFKIRYDGLTLHFNLKHINCTVDDEKGTLLIEKRDGRKHLINIDDISSMTTNPIAKGGVAL